MPLERSLNAMPKMIRDLLRSRGLMDEHESRSARQRNDCLGWMARARLEETR